MDLQTLERLLIDRRLGELPPDASTLLEAYLALTPESPDLATEIDTTITAARQALHASDTPAEALPKLDLQTTAARQKTPAATLPLEEPDETPFTLRPRQDARTWTRGLAVAAAIMIGFFLGSWHGADVVSPDPAQMASVEAPAQSQPQQPTGFWSLSRLRTLKEKAQRTPSSEPEVHWSNPIRRPQIGASS